MTRSRDHRCMIMQPSTFSVLTAPLAAIDRRALSQAWYSALHVVKHGPNGESRTKLQAVPAAPAGGGAPPSKKRTRANDEMAMRRFDKTRPAPQMPVAHGDRRAWRSALARKIELAFLRPTRTPVRTTLSIEGTGARVHVALQQTPAGLRLVAVCPARLRETVARALDEARFALAARGISLYTVLPEEQA
jgi:hypothetical protein